MVPLRSDYGESKISDWNGVRQRPRLVLCDTTTTSVPPARRPAVLTRKTLRRWEDRILGLATVSAVLFFVVSFLGFLWHAVSASYQNSFGSSAPVITRRVAPGDTLWRYAATYGDPNSYILDRVETIARDNHLSSHTALVPGQIVHIAVHNSVVISQLQRQHQSRIASLPRP